MRNGLNFLYTTEASSWIKPFFEEMALQSPALVMIAGAIQGYMDDGMSVKSMEYVDLALQTFRQELTTRYEKFHVATVCAGLLVCSLCVCLRFFTLTSHFYLSRPPILLFPIVLDSWCMHANSHVVASGKGMDHVPRAHGQRLRLAKQVKNPRSNPH